MISILKIRKNQGSQAIPDVKLARVKAPFKGLPVLDQGSCGQCQKCASVCPTEAITTSPLTLDLGKCVFCGDCERACGKKGISFTTRHTMAVDKRESLILDSGSTAEIFEKSAITVRKDIKSVFGTSLKLRQVSAGGCNGCELELNACGNVNFDMGRFGIEFVASPRHADGLLITGPLTRNMAPALDDAYHSTPDPKIVIVAGSCAISGGVFSPSEALNREFLDKYPVDLYLPGCPVHPLTVINGILSFLGR